MVLEKGFGFLSLCSKTCFGLFFFFFPRIEKLLFSILCPVSYSQLCAGRDVLFVYFDLALALTGNSCSHYEVMYLINYCDHILMLCSSFR